MLILNERSPNTSLYYLGAKLLNFLTNNSIHNIRLCDLYDRFKKIENIEFNRFLLTIDWLFIIGKIKLSDNGALKCI